MINQLTLNRDYLTGLTQNQALCSILFLYKNVLGKNFGWMGDLVKAKRSNTR